MAPQLPPDAAVGGGILTVVAVDKDKHSASAVKWAVDYLLVNNNITLILVHVRTKSSAHRTVGTLFQFFFNFHIYFFFL